MKWIFFDFNRINSSFYLQEFFFEKMFDFFLILTKNSEAIDLINLR